MIGWEAKALDVLARVTGSGYQRVIATAVRAVSSRGRETALAKSYSQPSRRFARVKAAGRDIRACDCLK